MLVGTVDWVDPLVRLQVYLFDTAFCLISKERLKQRFNQTKNLLLPIFL